MAVYFLQDPITGLLKIGTTNDVEARQRQLELQFGRPLALLWTGPGGHAEERAIHRRFAHLRIDRREQFRPGPEVAEFIGRPLLPVAPPDGARGIEGRRDVIFKLPINEHHRLRVLAASGGLSMATYVRDLVRENIAEERKRRSTP